MTKGIVSKALKIVLHFIEHSELVAQVQIDVGCGAESSNQVVEEFLAPAAIEPLEFRKDLDVDRLTNYMRKKVGAKHNTFEGLLKAMVVHQSFSSGGCSVLEPVRISKACVQNYYKCFKVTPYSAWVVPCLTAICWIRWITAFVQLAPCTLSS